MANFLEKYFCTILTFNQEDFVFFNNHYGNTGVEILLYNKESGTNFELPTQIVGNENVLEFKEYVSSKIKKIRRNLYWTTSPSIDKNQCLMDTEVFINQSAYEYKPYELLTFDAVLDGEFIDFINRNYTKHTKLYLYFFEKALYLYSSGKLSCISLESLKYTSQNVKLLLFQLMASYECIMFSYENFINYLPEKFEGPILTFENFYWIRHSIRIEERNFADFFNNNNIKRNIPYLFGMYVEESPLTDEEIVATTRFYKKDEITNWLNKCTIVLDKKVKDADFVNKYGKYFLKLKHNNKRTITNRINCVDKRLNPQVLPKKSEDRNHIIPAYKGGKIAVFDYVSFETKIALYSCGNKEFIEKYKDSDLHAETAAVIFQTKDLTSNQRSLGKAVNHILIYGGGEEKILEKLSGVLEPKNALERIKIFLQPIIEKSNEISQICKEIGYVQNPFGIIVKPQKIWAAFNNFIQSTAADIVVNKLFEIKLFLESNKYKSRFMYQVHDSFVFDLHPKELEIVNKIQEILSQNFSIYFNVEYVLGNTLMECTESSKSENDVIIHLD